MLCQDNLEGISFASNPVKDMKHEEDIWPIEVHIQKQIRPPSIEDSVPSPIRRHAPRERSRERSWGGRQNGNRRHSPNSERRAEHGLKSPYNSIADYFTFCVEENEKKKEGRRPVPRLSFHEEVSKETDEQDTLPNVS